MALEPGALRELHWHANAAEWAYVLEGNCRVTTIDPAGQWPRHLHIPVGVR
jgi:oxalate decarboxylase